MERLIEFIKGAAIGLANIVAGLSGGTIAVLLNIYEKLIDDISNVLKHPVLVLKDIWAILIGVFIGIIVGAVVVKRAYEGSPIITSSLFCGLVISGIPYLFTKIKGIKINYKHVIIFIISFSIVVILPFLTAGSSKKIDFNLSGFTMSTVLGAIIAIAMIIPGVSGSMIALSIGYYDTLLAIIDNMMHGSDLSKNIVLALFVVLGIVIGLLTVSKLIKHLLKKYFSYSYAGIIGLVSGSTIAIMVSAVKSEYYSSNHQWWQWVIGVLLFGIAGFFGYLITLRESKEENE